MNWAHNNSWIVSFYGSSLISGLMFVSILFNATQNILIGPYFLYLGPFDLAFRVCIFFIGTHMITRAQTFQFQKSMNPGSLIWAFEFLYFFARMGLA